MLFTTYSIPPLLRNKMSTDTGGLGERTIRSELRARGLSTLSSIADQFTKYDIPLHAIVPGTCYSTFSLSRYRIDKLSLFECSPNLGTSHSDAYLNRESAEKAWTLDRCSCNGMLTTYLSETPHPWFGQVADHLLLSYDANPRKGFWVFGKGPIEWMNRSGLHRKWRRFNGCLKNVRASGVPTAKVVNCLK
jgi:hypothetical protein